MTWLRESRRDRKSIRIVILEWNWIFRVHYGIIEKLIKKILQRKDVRYYKER